MIRKIAKTQYLKGWGTMTAQEREEYRKRVGEWLSSDGERLLTITDRPMAQMQNVMQMSVRWSREQCQAWYEGVRLLTALVDVAETWLPTVLYSKSAWRGVRKLVDELSGVQDLRYGSQEAGAAKEEPAANTCKGTQGTGRQTTPSGKPTEAQREVGTPVGTPTEAQREVGIPVETPTGAQREVGMPAGKQQGVTKGTGVPVRPKHIDQYLHLLPKGTQERGAMVRGLLRELDEAREKARLLMGDDHASANSRAAWAKKATKIDEQLAKIYKELDKEWEKLVQSGRVVVDELGQAHVVEVAYESREEPSGEPTGAQREAGVPAGIPMDASAEQGAKRGRKSLTEEEKAAKAAEREKKRKQMQVRRAGLIRKWLIDTRNAKTEEQKEKWMQKYKEMVAIGGEQAVTKKVRAAAEYYGIEVNS